ncbi:MAG: hypothetical protein R6V03_03885 [Kiritimatiellia bacterium]
MAGPKTQITKKKKKLTLKSSAVKSQAPKAEDGGSQEGEAAEGAQLEVPQVKPQSYTVWAMLALAAALIFISLLVLQWLEWQHYHQPPSAFPSKAAYGAR